MQKVHVITISYSGFLCVMAKCLLKDNFIFIIMFSSVCRRSRAKASAAADSEVELNLSGYDSQSLL